MLRVFRRPVSMGENIKVTVIATGLRNTRSIVTTAEAKGYAAARIMETPMMAPVMTAAPLMTAAPIETVRMEMPVDAISSDLSMRSGMVGMVGRKGAAAVGAAGVS